MTKRIFLRWIKKFENTGHNKYPVVQKVGSILMICLKFLILIPSMLVHTSTVYTPLITPIAVTVPKITGCCRRHIVPHLFSSSHHCFTHDVRQGIDGATVVSC